MTRPLRVRARVLAALVLAGSSAPLHPLDPPASAPAPGLWRVEVVAPEAQLRARPAVDSEILGALAPGERLDVLSWLPEVQALALPPASESWPDPGFWIEVADQAGRRGWVTSPQVLPENAWPKTTWYLAHIETACDSKSAATTPGRALFDTIRVFDLGRPQQVATFGEEALAARRRILDRLATLDSVEILARNGTLETRKALGMGGVCDPCTDGPGAGPLFQSSADRDLSRRALAVAGLASSKPLYPMAELWLVRRPFFRFRDEKHLLATLQRFERANELPIAALERLHCQGPLALSLSATWSSVELFSCDFTSGPRRWQLLFGNRWEGESSSPWLVRFARDLESDTEEPDSWPLAEADLERWYVTDLNQDDVLELWLGTQVRVLVHDYDFFAWEIYFLKHGQAFGPWFLDADGGSSCD